MHDVGRVVLHHHVFVCLCTAPVPPQCKELPPRSAAAPAHHSCPVKQIANYHPDVPQLGPHPLVALDHVVEVNAERQRQWPRTAPKP